MADARSATWRASTELNEFLGTAWPSVGQVFQIERTVWERGQMRQETMWGITSLSPHQATPLRLLQLIRRHWTIENRLHWRRDVSLREDHCQVRKGAAPLVLAALNNTILAILDLSRGAQCPPTNAGLRCPAAAGCLSLAWLFANF